MNKRAKLIGLRSDAIEKSKYFDIAELHMKVLVGNILKGLNKNG